MIYVYTSILNAWDNLRPPAVAEQPGVRYLCFTNLPNLPRVDPWEYRPVCDVGEACRTARLPKILPHLMLPADAEYSIYHDGNFQLRANPLGLIDTLLAEHDWAAHRHPCRQCIYDEAKVLLDEKIGTRELIEREIAGYRVQHYPSNQGLWANGMLVRRHTPQVAAVNEHWWKLYAVGCERDQLSFPVARAAAGLAVRTVDADVWRSPFLNFYWHAAWKDKQSSLEYVAERSKVRLQLQRLSEVIGENASLRYPEY